MSTEKHAAEILLDRGVSWPVNVPWFLRIQGKRRITIKALRLGTLLQLSLRWEEMGIKMEDLQKDPHGIIRNHLRDVCSITAVCILNSKLLIRIFTRPLSRYILWKFTANMLLEVMVFITTYGGVESFLDTIGLISDLKITAPRNPSPESQGSQQK